jgi:Pectate lyase superfamily protein
MEQRDPEFGWDDELGLGAEEHNPLTRRAALIGAAAVGGAGVASLVGPASALAATSEYFTNAVDFGVIGNGVANDTTGLQEAINSSIATGKPLYLPPGTYKITSGLKAEASNFCMFGAGMRKSVLAPNSNSFDGLTVGPGAGGSGNVPGGYCRDFGIKGGGSSAEISKKGVEKTTGNAAFKLSGMRLYEITNVGVFEGSFDIGFDLVNNSFGAIFNNCRTDFNVCRVGMNVREANQSGNDSNWGGCWFSGEVACVHISGNAGGFHFRGGQLNVNLQGTEAEDKRGAIVIGKEYTTQSTEGDTVNVNFDGMDFEECRYAWFIRGFGQHSLAMRDCAFLANAEKPTVGVYKNSAFKNGRMLLENCRVKGTFSAVASALATIEEGFGGRTWVEYATSGGSVSTGSGEVNVDDSPLAMLAKMDFAFAVAPEQTLLPRELLMRNAGVLEISFDWGVTWTKVGPSAEEMASAKTMTINKGVSLVKVSGTSEIKKVNATVAGHLVVFKFAAAAKMVDGENLKLAKTEAATADDTLTMICDGTNWYEVARSAN